MTAVPRPAPVARPERAVRPVPRAASVAGRPLTDDTARDGGAGAGGDPGAWTAAWSQALADLEIEVDRAEALLRLVHSGRDVEDDTTAAGPRPAWTPPTGLGPLPVPLTDRASALLARQREVSLRLAEAAHQNRRHTRAAVAHREAPPAVPVYLDVAL